MTVGEQYLSMRAMQELDCLRNPNPGNNDDGAEYQQTADTDKSGEFPRVGVYPSEQSRTVCNSYILASLLEDCMKTSILWDQSFKYV